MRRLRALLVRLRATLFGDRGADRSFREELESHLAHHIDDLVRTGLAPVEARRRALAALGGLEPARERQRDQRGLRWLRELGQDARYGVRVLARRPGFGLAATLTLALGIGANASLFNLIDRLVLRPLPVSDPDRLIGLSTADRETFDAVRLDRIEQGARTLSAVVSGPRVYGREPVDVGGARHEAIVQAVSANYFDALGISATVGRVFGAADGGYAQDGVAVISDAWWLGVHGRDPGILGQRAVYRGREFVIVGVAPPGFRGVQLETPADLWLPVRQTVPPDDALWTRASWLLVLARLAPGATRAQAAAETSALAGLDVSVGRGAGGFSTVRRDFTWPLVVLQAIVGLVLLIACGNLANLMLARGAFRTRELAIRRAVGASQGRLVRQLATESLLLAATGGALGLVVAWWMNRALLSFLPADAAGAATALAFHGDGRVLTFGLGVTLGTLLLFGVLPAVRVARGGHAAALSGRAPAGRPGGVATSRLLVVSEVALCTVLLVAAVLFVSTFRNLWRIDSGFVSAGLVSATVDVRAGMEDRTRLFDTLVERVRTLPGVRRAGYSRVGQMTGGGISYPVYPAGQADGGDSQPSALEQRVTPGFLEAMGTRLVAGRSIDARDTADAPPVALVNEAFARLVFGGTSPVGRRFGLDAESSGELEVVGLVQDSKWADLREAPQPMFYRPVAQRPAPAATLAIAVDSDPEPLMAALPEVARAVDPRLAVRDVVPFADVVNGSIATEHMVAWVSFGFAVLAAVIVSVGLYGVLAYGVARRTRELGVRMALGAGRHAVRWMVVRESLASFAVGFGLGAAVAAAGSRYAASLLFGIEPLDPATYVTVFVILGLVLVAASWMPTRRATRIDPMTALRID